MSIKDSNIVETIYVDFIDGTNVWIPVKAKHIRENIYLILEIDEFDDEDPTQLPEFFPGDTVEATEHTFKNGETGKIAKKLVAPSSHSDRKYFDFLYKMLMNKISFSKQTFEKHKEEIERIKRENATGQYFYPKILKTINELEINRSLK